MLLTSATPPSKDSLDNNTDSEIRALGVVRLTRTQNVVHNVQPIVGLRGNLFLSVLVFMISQVTGVLEARC